MTKYWIRLSIASAALLALSAVPAFAYPESTTNVEPSGPPPLCSDCHGLESITQDPATVAQASKPATWSDSEAGTFVGSRKGPHGGYTSGTQKCNTCHMVHSAAGNTALLAEATIADTCNTCHDGTGGGGVYGVIAYRAGPAARQAGHRIGADSLNATGAVTVPGGSTSAGSFETTFTGENGSLTCTDCHSPHNADTVAPFVGDRKRSSADTSTAVATNRLLRKMPTKASASVDVYGSDWCESCHKGSHVNSALVANHPVARNADGYNYSRVIRRLSYDTTASGITTGLGGSNLGYVMPDENTATVRPVKPICQQCHEDARVIGTDATQKFTVDSQTESFTINTDGVDSNGVGGGNPRFQNFPHETMGKNLLIETWPDGELCRNCHLEGWN